MKLRLSTQAQEQRDELVDMFNTNMSRAYKAFRFRRGIGFGNSHTQLYLDEVSKLKLNLEVRQLSHNTTYKNNDMYFKNVLLENIEHLNVKKKSIYKNLTNTRNLHRSVDVTTNNFIIPFYYSLDMSIFAVYGF